MNTHTDYVLRATIAAVGLRTTGPYTGEYFEVSLSKSNIKKVLKVAEAVKYGATHLVVEFKDWESFPHLKLWGEVNNDSNYDRPITLIGIEHDLESLID